MNYGDLDYFVTVVQSGSLTRAAEQLGITQPSISKAIGRVEEDAGACLFTRSGNKIQLNQYGKIYYKAALKALGLIEDAIDEIKDRNGRTDGFVRIASTVSGFLDPVMSAFHLEHPEHKLCQYLLPQETLIDTLLSGKIDFAFSTTPIYEKGIRWIPLQTDELYMFVSPEHPLYGTQSASLRQFAQDPIVINNSGMNDNSEVIRLCHQAGFEPRILYAGGESEMIAELVNRGSVSFISASTIMRMRNNPYRPEQEELRDAPDKGYIRITEPICLREYGMAILEGHYRSPAVQI